MGQFDIKKEVTTLMGQKFGSFMHLEMLYIINMLVAKEEI